MTRGRASRSSRGRSSRRAWTSSGWPRRSRCSPSRTVTSACAATSTRASRAGLSGTYLNGFYESFPLEYGERGYGFAEDGQSIVNVTDGKIIRLQVEDEPLDVHRGEVDPPRAQARLPHRAARAPSCTGAPPPGHEVQAHARGGSCRSRCAASWRSSTRWRRSTSRSGSRSSRTSRRTRSDARPRRRPAPGRGAARRAAAAARRWTTTCASCSGTRPSARGLAMAVGHGARARARRRRDARSPSRSPTSAGSRCRPSSSRAGRCGSYKLLAYHWSSQQSVDWLRDQVDASLESGLAEGFEGLAEAQRETLDRYWQRADIEVEGDPRAPAGAALRAVPPASRPPARNEGRAIPAKGLTGSGYDGHAFWDTESFVLPGAHVHGAAHRAPRARVAPLHARHARASAPGSSACAARPCRGGRSTARSARATGRPARPPST